MSILTRSLFLILLASPAAYPQSDHKHNVPVCVSPSVDKVKLSTSLLEFGASDKDIEVTVSVINPYNDVIKYGCWVTAGTIIGNGPKVIWSLKDVQPGTYDITAGVDDGCGFCGKTATKTITIN